MPTGQAQVQFRAANLNFHAGTYNWLVVSGNTAWFQGTGTINGAGEYGFLVTVVDGQGPDGDGADRFRIKIWDKLAGNDTVYDGEPALPEGALPTIAIQGGSIVIHQ